MIAETVNNQISKTLLTRRGIDHKKDVVANKNITNIGLRIPGSNWQTFKSLITEGVSNEKNSGEIQKKRKKRNRKSSQKSKESEVQQTKIQQIPKTETKENETKEEPDTELTKRKKCFRKPVQQCIESKVQQTKDQHFVKTKTEEDAKTKKPQNELTKVVAMDCEMVGIGDGQDSMIARVSVVNRYGVCIYDKYVKPTEEVKNYRTPVSGIRPHHLENGEDFKIVQKEVADILRGRILVGHALHNDLSVLFLSHPKRFQRDTSRYKVFRRVTKGNTPSLKKLASELLGIDIQSGEHNSVEDAHASMQLYQLFRKKWEHDIRTQR